MSITLGAIASFVGVVTSIIAIAGLWVEIRRSRLGLQTETALRLDERFYSAEMLAKRSSAARKLLEGSPNNHELADVLDFFTTIAILLERDAIDEELAYDFHAYWLVGYWRSAQAYIEAARKTDPESWQVLERLVDKFLKRKVREAYSDAELEAFLQEERFYEEQAPKSNPA